MSVDCFNFDLKLKNSDKYQYKGLLCSNQLNLTQGYDYISDFDFVDLSSTDFLSKVPSNLRLGSRVEVLFHYYLNHSGRYKVLASNLQINNNTRTIGELDYIIYDMLLNLTVHLELAYKFYCYDSRVSEIEQNRWIGPNRKDSLKEKFQKLIDKQFPIIRKAETVQLLNQKNIKLIEKQSLCFFAQLFVPRGLYKSEEYKNGMLFSQSIVGFWVGFSEFEFFYKVPNYKFYIPLKKDWIVEPLYNELWYEFDIVEKELNLNLVNNRSTLVWINKGDIIFEKCFVVWW